MRPNIRQFAHKLCTKHIMSLGGSFPSQRHEVCFSRFLIGPSPSGTGDENFNFLHCGTTQAFPCALLQKETSISFPAPCPQTLGRIYKQDGRQYVKYQSQSAVLRNKDPVGYLFFSIPSSVGNISLTMLPAWSLKFIPLVFIIL